MEFFQLGILGMTGYGKTFFTKRLVEKINHSRTIIIDDLNQIHIKNYTVIDSIDKFLYYILNNKKFKLIVRLQNLNDYKIIFRTIWELHNLLIVIDELSLFCDSYNVSQTLKNIFQRGRLKNISTIYNTQRPANIHRSISSQTEFLISFKLSEYSDFKQFYLDKSKINNILKLDRYKYLFIRGEQIEFEKRLGIAL